MYKEKAINFLKMAAAGQAAEAFRLYGCPGFRHHNAYFRGDADTLMTAMDEAAKVFPDKIFEIQRAVEEEDIVAVHSRIKQCETEPDYAVIHIFRFSEEGIIEMWDFGQAVPDNIVNENGMF